MPTRSRAFMYDLVRTSNPAARVVSAADLRAHLRLDSSDQDTYLEALIDAATESLEVETNRAFITQTWAMRLDSFWSDWMELPRAPLQSVSSVAYIDTDGNAQTLSASKYTVVTNALVGRLHTAYGETLPGTRTQTQAVTVTYVAGYGDAATDCPAVAVHAVKLLASHFFTHAEPVLSGPGAAVTPVPDTIMRLVANLRARGAL